MFYIYKCWLLTLKKAHQVELALEIFETYIYPLYIQYTKCKEDKHLIKKNPQDITKRIEQCMFKLLASLEQIEPNSMEIDDVVDHESIEEAIIASIVVDENESGISDLEEECKELNENKEKIFEISKTNKDIKNEINQIFDSMQVDDVYKPINNILKEEQKESQSFTEQVDENCLTTNETISEENIEHTITMKKIQNEFSENENLSRENDPYSNYNKYKRPIIPKRTKRKNMKNTHHLLKDFNPKFIKRENIDKRIFRRFRNYVKENYLYISSISTIEYDCSFWNEFCSRNLLPPMTYTETKTQIIKQFKSFNTKYFIWLFNKKGTNELYSHFITHQGKELLINFINEYHLTNSNENDIITKLNNYIYNIPFIYSISPSLNEHNRLCCEEITMNTFLYQNEDYFYAQRMLNNPFEVQFDYEKKLYKEDENDDQYSVCTFKYDEDN